MTDFIELFKTMVKERASDLFIKVDGPPTIRVDGKIKFVNDVPVSEEDANSLFEKITDERAKRIFDQEGEVDTAYESPDAGRFRANIFRQRGHVGFVFRHLQLDIPSFEELKLPGENLKQLSAKQRGLILVTGIAGSGKSTTIACMVNYINNNFNKHIVTIEDPIEYLFFDKKSIIDQREIGLDTKSFYAALKHCVRQSPDVIFIGEMRDKDTMEAAISAAETGHLVFSTLHTINAQQTVERIINFFPVHQHALIRLQLSMLLEGVISQRLLPKKSGVGRVPAIELLLATPTVKELLFEGKTRDILKALEEGSYYGTLSFNQSLKQLYDEELITLEEALAAADNPDELKLEIRGISKGTKTSDFDFDY